MVCAPESKDRYRGIDLLIGVPSASSGQALRLRARQNRGRCAQDDTNKERTAIYGTGTITCAVVRPYWFVAYRMYVVVVLGYTTALVARVAPTASDTMV